MQKEFLKNIYLLLFINVIIKPVYILGIDAQVQNAVGDSTYGVYFAILDFCFLFQVILDAGIQNYNSVNISKYRTAVADQFANVLATKLILIVLFALSVFSFAFFIGYPQEYYNIILLMVVIMSTQTFFVYLRSHFPALGFYKYEKWLSVFDKVLMILIIGYFIYIAQNITIQTFMFGQIMAFIIAIIVTLFLLRKKFTLRLEFNLQKSKTLIKKSLPFALVFVLMTLYTRMDGVMLERLIPDNGLAAGRYVKGFRLMDAANMIGFLFSVFLLPMFAKLIGDKESPNVLVITAVKIQISISLIITLACWFYAKDILELLYIKVSSDSIISFKYLMVSFLAMAMSYIFGSLITATGKLKKLNAIFIIGIIINWSLNLYLIPKLQAQGAAIATLVTQFFVFGGQLVLATARFKIQYNLDFVLRLIGLVGIYFAAIYIMAHYISVYWLLEVIIFCVLCLGISILFGFLRFNNTLRVS